MIAAIVLAAGKSLRMGTQKLLLPISGRPLITHVVREVLESPVGKVLAVLRPGAEAMAGALAGMPVTLVTNSAADGDMLSSIRCGLRALPDQTSGFLIVPCDQPGLTADLIARLLAAKEESGKSIAVPVCHGRRGHPVLLDIRHREAILNGCDAIGLRGLLHNHAGDIAELVVNDPDVLSDLDVPEDYARWCAEEHHGCAAAQGRPDSDFPAFTSITPALARDMVSIGTPLSPTATRIALLGAGELGKEVVIELQRLGCEVIAIDRYPNAPAMQVAHRSHVIDMLDGAALRGVLETERPHLIVPEVEAIATATLVEMEKEGFTVIPTARAAQLTMNREGIRRLAAEELGLRCSPYRFAATEDEYRAAVRDIGGPCVVKPIMSSSGKGQSVVKCDADMMKSWRYAQEGGRAGAGKVIVEGFVDFEYEITLLTVRHTGGTSFCEPIGHIQIDGDYRESWQPQLMSPAALNESRRIAETVTGALGGRGIFGVELFIRGDTVWFSEVSPRPHDTGLVTLVSQDLSEFALHARAILGLPIPVIRQFGPSASAVILPEGHSNKVVFSNLESALAEPDTQLRLFGKPEVKGRRRMGVVACRAESIEAARAKARRAAGSVCVQM